ncbi:hypothetical protein BU036_02545 [Staphylococcus simulans]|uniref:hypothetical protein n=1 Tax=Staphylococcus simulans TaxID=1286 RepID=UPI000E6A93D5|nr:hypothetical protein [Staphylococcus simulans]RIN51269.1 hypothetical protein BU036_02545 [Staphylococcus simulans]
MKVRIGNLKIEKVLDKLGITLPKEVVEHMEARYQPSACHAVAEKQHMNGLRYFHLMLMK